ncbi:MAG: HAD family phosphatase [Eggerthellaceae bacterium]|nr:HAD family phosphatase [Eggerthellaceae bacterium]
MPASSPRTRTHAVVFDCDGTLLDSMPAWHALEADLAWMAGITLTPQQISMLNANTLEQTVGYFHRSYGVGRSEARLLEEARGILLEHYCTDVQPREGACELVERLRADGVRLAVASSSPRVLLRVGLERAGVFDAFDLVASAEDEHATKRDPAFLLSVAERIDARPRDAWCVDDSAYALKAAKLAGFSTVGIYDSDDAGTPTQLRRTANVFVRSFAELDYWTLVGGAYAA